MNLPLQLGTVVDADDGESWVIDAVMVTGCERYYMLVDKHRTVAMWPAFMVEAMKVRQPSHVEARQDE